MAPKAEKKPAEEKKSTMGDKAPVEKQPKAEKKLLKEGGTGREGKKKKRNKKCVETYKIYIFKVLKQVVFYKALKDVKDYAEQRWISSPNWHVNNSVEGLVLGGLAGGLKCISHHPFGSC